jgi:Mor family transcriptional regulator
VAEIQRYCEGGGCSLYIPKQKARAKTRRQTLIKALHQHGVAIAVIAQRAECTARYVRKVLAQARHTSTPGGA